MSVSLRPSRYTAPTTLAHLLLFDDLCDDDSDHDGDNGEKDEREPEADPAHLPCPTSVDDGLVGLFHTIWSVRSGDDSLKIGI